MTAFIAILLVVLGLALLYLGGEALLRGAVGLAILLHMTPAIIGLTVVAAGTSIPELAVSSFAAFQGENEIAVANVVGSNIFNICAIIGMCALVRSLDIGGNTIRLEYPVLLLVTLLCVAMAQHEQINRLDGILFLAIYVGFMVYSVHLVRAQVTAQEETELETEVTELVPDKTRPKWWLCLLLVAGGILLLTGGAHLTVTGAVQLAEMIGWSERVIGLTIVSAGTGLPEVAASFVSTIRGRTDIALGNVIGSNLFNILAILGVASLITPLSVQADLAFYDCWWMLGVTLLLFPLLVTRLRVGRIEGAILVAVYAVYLGLLLQRPS
ncbi:MAG: calcium/sodium antiporter [Gemmatales bacterium]|nr:calcium/sodium antiporter [Gemmatales bacterium]MDW8386767.1 calcium/sodium antiporter [Gemmatales bacterium]